MICNFPLLFSHFKNIRMSTLFTIIITYYLLIIIIIIIITKSHNNYCSVGVIYLVHFLKFWNVPRFSREISKFQKSELAKFISNFPLKHVITSTNSRYLHLKIFQGNLVWSS